MAFFRGEQGTIFFDKDSSGGVSEVAAVRSWSMTIEKDVLETTALGATYKSNVGGLIAGSGTVELIYTASSADETNVFIEAANTATDQGVAAFELFLDTTGTKKISFVGLITSADYGATVGELEVITCNFVTSGTITLGI
jgi:hypothetical protein